MKKLISVLCAFLIVLSQVTAFADGVKDMMAGKQDLVILGSVKDIKDGKVTVTVDHVLGRTGTSLAGTDITVLQFLYSYCEQHSTGEFRSPRISDNIAISLNETDGVYKMANCAYKVDSNEYASCKIVVHEDIREEECIRPLLEATCYLRSNARVKEFEFDEEGRIYAVYPQTAEQCVHVVSDDGTAVITGDSPDTLPTVPPAAPAENPLEESGDKRWILALALLGTGIIAGALAGYVIILRSNKL